MGRLIYNKEFNQYEVWEDTVEGASRSKVASATEEYVIDVILQQDKIMNSLNQFDTRMDNVRIDLKNRLKEHTDKLFDMMKLILKEIEDFRGEEEEKRWWMFWR